MSSIDFSHQSDDDIFNCFKCHLKTFQISLKCPKIAFFTDEIEVTSIPDVTDACEYLCYLTMLSTMVEGKV